MAEKLFCTVPLKTIRKISVCLSDCKKTLQQVKADTGADYIVNGTLYDMRTHKVNCHLKVAGTVVAKPDYTVYGYAWGLGPDIAMTKLPCAAANYIACTPLIVDGKKVAKLTYDPGQGGKRGRTAIGIRGDTLALYCAKDGTTAARTPEALRDDLTAAGWDSAVMLDGGDSAQCSLAGEVIRTGRQVQHWICVWTDKNTKEEDKPMNNLKVMPYSLSLAGDKALSKNFKVREFRCHDGTDTVFIADELVSLLQKIRDHYGKAVNINSGYRTEAWNKAHGGAAQSQHKYGRAADIHIDGVTPKALAAYVESIMPGTGGIGIYKSFTHVDVRANRARWNG